MAHQQQFSGRPIEFGWRNAGPLGTSSSVNPASSQHVALQMLVIVTAALVIPASWLVPGHLILPTAAFAALSLAGLAALMAWRFRIARDRGVLNLWDVAGIMALISFGACMLSEPQAVMQLFDSGDPRSHGPQR